MSNHHDKPQIHAPLVNNMLLKRNENIAAKAAIAHQVFKGRFVCIVEYMLLSISVMSNHPDSSHIYDP